MSSPIAPIRRVARALLGLAVVVALGAPAAPVMAWGTSGNNYGTHDYIIDGAVTVADGRVDDWFNLDVAMLSSDDPDTVENSQAAPLMEHIYKPGVVHGGAIDRIAREYDAAQAAYRRGTDARAAGDKAAAREAFDDASYHIGLLAHVLGDLSQPFHTSLDGNGLTDLHNAYELLVNNASRFPTDMPEWRSSRRTVTTITDVRTVAVGIAAYSASKFATVYADLTTDGVTMTPGLRDVTGLLLRRAQNDLADIIWSISQGAGAQPAVGSIVLKPRWTGVASGGSETLEVWVKDSHGAPIEGMRVDVLWPTSTGPRPEIIYTGPGGYGRRTASAGTSPRLSQLPVTGTTTVRGVASTRRTWWAITPALATGTAGLRTSVADTTVARGQVARVTTKAHDAKGRGVPNLLVTWTWRLANGSTIRTRGITDADGTARSTLPVTARMPLGTVSVTTHTQAASRNRTVSTSLKIVR